MKRPAWRTTLGPEGQEFKPRSRPLDSLPSLRGGTPHCPCVGVPPTSQSWRATLAGLAAREPSRWRTRLDSPRARQNSSSTRPPPLRNGSDDRDPCLAELLLHLGGEQTPGRVEHSGRDRGVPPRPSFFPRMVLGRDRAPEGMLDLRQTKPNITLRPASETAETHRHIRP
jgi:hypothetical protein